ncbi:barstar family protein [Streptomyces sp. NPDC002580]|uniref:barstar family protein n=1 Tax=Streptomyces sp. NPDC002580 TaxID=3364653 RepID=UPI00369C4072
MFSLRADDGDDTRLGFFSDIRDFFTGHEDALSEFDPEADVDGEDRGCWLSPRLIGPDAPGALRRALHPEGGSGDDPVNVWIDLHDTTGRTIGSYFAGAVTLERWEEEEGGTAVATLSCWLASLPEAGAHEVWKAWSRRSPTAVNDWVSLPIGQREGWLEVARKYLGAAGKVNPRREQYTLDGANISDVASFYCAIGEAMNGPGGYYGSNLAALDDCLFGGFGPAAPFRLVWESSEVAADMLGGLPAYHPNASVLDLIVNCLERRGVTVEFA